MNFICVKGWPSVRAWASACVFWLGSATATQALAFECDKPTNPLDTAVCAQPKLRAMAEKIDEAVGHISHHSAHPEHIKENQKNWLGLANQCAQNLRCLNEMLERRLERLEKIEAVQAAAPPKHEVHAPAKAGEHGEAHSDSHAAPHAEDPADANSHASVNQGEQVKTDEGHGHGDAAGADEKSAEKSVEKSDEKSGEKSDEKHAEKMSEKDDDEEVHPPRASGLSALGAAVADWVKAHPFLIVALLVASWLIVGALFVVQKMGWLARFGVSLGQSKSSAKALSSSGTSAATPGKPARVSGKVSKTSPAEKGKSLTQSGKSPTQSGKLSAAATKPGEQGTVLSKWWDRLGEKFSWWRFFIKHQFRNHPKRAYGILLLLVLTLSAVGLGVTQWMTLSGPSAPLATNQPTNQPDPPSAPGPAEPEAATKAEPPVHGSESGEGKEAAVKSGHSEPAEHATH